MTSEQPPARPAIVLVEPRIPQNVGAIARLCAATRAQLHVVRPLPFRLNDRELRRAGMDYLELLDLHVHDDWAAAKEALAPRRLWFLTRFSGTSFHAQSFSIGDALVFGSEPAGMPEHIAAEYAGRDVRIAMVEPEARCLNLATAAAVALYEVLRQAGELG